MTTHSNMKTEKNEQKKKNITCPNCKSANLIKRGKRKTENRGLIQRYGCKDCSYRFVADDGFFRMRNTPQKITQSIDLFYRGISTRKVQEHLAIFHPHNASNVSIYNWVVKYAKMISKFTRRLKVKVSEEVQIDEMEFHRRKHHKRRAGAEKNWFIDSIDPGTRFLIASAYSKNRGIKEVKAVVQDIRSKTDNQIKIMTTDGWQVYTKMKKVFGYNLKAHQYNVIHNKVNASAGEGFNYSIERLHNSIRARLKVMRGFHGSIHSADLILKGFEVYYNFITKNQAIKCCPYELAVPELKESLEESENKWLKLIYLAKEAYL